MRFKTCYFLGLAALFFLIVPILTFAKTDKIVLIKFENNESLEVFLRSNKDSQKSKIKNLARIKNPSVIRQQWLKISSKINPEIEYIEIGDPIRKAIVPNDSYYPQQWGFPAIGASKAWDVGTGSDANTIAIVDTGIQLNHPDLDNKIWVNETEQNGDPGVDDDANGFVDDIYGWDFGNDDNNPSDSVGHGTAVAGVAAAESNNNQGITGVDWQAKLIAVKVWEDGEEETSPDIAALGVKYAADMGAKIINMSWGAFTDWSVIKEAVDYAYAKGAILVGATGNEGQNQVYYPAKYTNVIGVGSINSSGQLSSFTNRGTGLDLAAPGDSIYTTFKGSNYISGSGTSLAAPFVSGAIALVSSTQPNLTATQIKTKLQTLGNSVSGYNLKYLNLWRSLQIRLLKTANSPSYLIDDNKKYPLPASSAFWQRFGFSSSFVETVSAEVLAEFEDGGLLKSLWKPADSSSVYLIDSLRRFQIWSSSVFWGMWGFTQQNVITLSPDLVACYPYATYLTALVKSSNSSQVYYIDNGGKRHGMWSSSAFWQMWGFSKTQDVVVLSQSFINSLPYARMLTVLVKAPNSSKVYYIDRGRKKYPMWSSAVFWEMWGFRFKDVTTISQGQLSTMPTQKSLTALVRPASGGDLYYVDNGGKKYRIPPGPYLWSMWGFSLSDVSTISNAQFNALPSAGDLSLYTRGHLTPWVTGRMLNAKCILSPSYGNPVSTLTQGQFDLLRRR